MGLIKKGIKAFNIFDSIYVNNKEDLETAKLLIKEAFNEAGVNPTLKTEYEEHVEEQENATFNMEEILAIENDRLNGGESDASCINDVTDEEIVEIYEQKYGPMLEHERAYKILEIRYRLAGMLERQC